MAQVKVRYKGVSDRRVITQKELKERNISVDKDLVFETRNGWSQVLDAPDELVKLLKDQPGFTISEVKDSGEIGDEIISASSVDDTADSTIQDTTTGQTTTAEQRRRSASS